MEAGLVVNGDTRGPLEDWFWQEYAVVHLVEKVTLGSSCFRNWTPKTDFGVALGFLLRQPKRDTLKKDTHVLGPTIRPFQEQQQCNPLSGLCC